MTNEEAIEVLETKMTNSHIPNELEAMKMAVEAIDAQIPKKPIEKIFDCDHPCLLDDEIKSFIDKNGEIYPKLHRYDCPSCEYTYVGMAMEWGKGELDYEKAIADKYCVMCGQKIDWSEYDKRRSD